MTPLFPARRAAEEFAGVIEGSRADVADRYSSLTATIELLREQPVVEARGDFALDLRSRLMDAADTLLQAQARRAPARDRDAVVIPLAPRRRRLASAAAVAAVVVGGTAGMAAAAQSALPGDALYPVKRGIETVESRLNTSDAGRGADVLNQAGTRLAEVKSLSADNASAEEITTTLASFESTANEAADLLFTAYQADSHASDIGKVREFAASNMVVLASLAKSSPASTRDAFASAADTLAAIDTQARTLCASCGGSALGMPTSLGSASALNALITAPTRFAVKDAKAHEAQSSSAAGGTSSSTQAPLEGKPAPTSVTSSSATTTVPSVPSTGSVKEGLSVTTDGVTGLLNQVNGATGGLTKPLTDPLDATLNSTVGSLTNGLLP